MHCQLRKPVQVVSIVFAGPSQRSVHECDVGHQLRQKVGDRQFAATGSAEICIAYIPAQVTPPKIIPLVRLGD